MKAYTYRMTKVEEFSVEAEDQSEAEDAVNSYLAREGIRGQDVDVEPVNITEVQHEVRKVVKS